MPTQKRSLMRATPSKAQLFVLGLLCVVSAFAAGTRTAGTVQTVGSIEALGGRLPGDVNGDDRIDVSDAVVILEIVNGYRDESPEALLGDPTSDGRLTIDDALRILRSIETVPLS